MCGIKGTTPLFQISEIFFFFLTKKPVGPCCFFNRKFSFDHRNKLCFEI